MAERKFAFVPGEYYHLYNRGNSKQVIFLDDYDYVRFQRLLFLANSSKSFKVEYIRDSRMDFYEVDRGEKLVAIGAYCLMPNHFHVLVTPLVDHGISAFMKKLGGYSTYFNKKYDRSGSLFEGKFKAQIAEDDEYLRYLFAYIHLNPLKLIDADWKERDIKNNTQFRRYLSNYPYSSLTDHLGEIRRENKIIDLTRFPQYFRSTAEVEHNVYDWLTNRKDRWEAIA